MSGVDLETEDLSANCRKLQPPKSLQGKENADVIWEIITKRFPKAAPLFCEIEAVIDRADDLLRQLRTPCNKILERSGPQEISNSEEANDTFLLTYAESLPEQNIVLDNDVVTTNIAEVQVSESSISELDVEPEIPSQDDEIYICEKPNASSSSSDQQQIDFQDDQGANRKAESKIPVLIDSKGKHDERSFRTKTKEVSSLEEWEKVADNAMPRSTDTFDADLSSKKTVILEDEPSFYEEIEESDELIDHKRIFFPSEDEINSSKIASFEKKRKRSISETTHRNESRCAPVDLNQDGADIHRVSEKTRLGPKILTSHAERENTVGDSIGYDITSQNQFGAVEINDEKTSAEVQGSGDKNIWKNFHSRTALDILVEYALRCNVEIEYQCTKSKYNRYEITGKLLDFSATGCGNTEELAKISLATKILQNVADHQMNDKEMKGLLELSKEQILEIMNFGMYEPKETTQRKLYKLCLKQCEPPPSYDVREKAFTHQGLRCIAKCTALGFTAEGDGVTRGSAKKAAAEKLYQLYIKNGNCEAKIN